MLVHLLRNKCRKFMNPQLAKEEIKYFKNLGEIQLEITKIILKEHKKQEGNSEEIKKFRKSPRKTTKENKQL